MNPLILFLIILFKINFLKRANGFFPSININIEMVCSYDEFYTQTKQNKTFPILINGEWHESTDSWTECSTSCGIGWQ